MNRKELWVNKKLRSKKLIEKRWTVIYPAWQSLKNELITKDDYDNIVHHIDIWYYKELEYINQDKKIREVE